MKKLTKFTATAIVLFLASMIQIYGSIPQNEEKVICSSDIERLSAGWISDFNRQNPESIIMLQVRDQGEMQKLSEVTTGENIYLLSNKCISRQVNTNNSIVPIGREIWVWVFNNENPYTEQIKNKGISPEELSAILNHPEAKGWEVTAGDKETMQPVHYYRLKSAKEDEQVNRFFRTKNIYSTGQALNDPAELVAAIQQQKYALAFCKLTDVINPANHQLADHIMLLPIDRNSNGKLDYFENFYSSLPDFNRAVWLGKYPGILLNDIYAISDIQNVDDQGMHFLKWILTDGQAALENFGYSELTASEKRSTINKLMYNEAALVVTEDTDTGYRTFILLLGGFIMLGIVVNYFYRRIRQKRNEKDPLPVRTSGILSEETLEIPEGVYFDKSHTWAFMEQDGKVKVGIDDFLQRVSGTFTKITSKKAGEQVKKNEALITLLQDGKHLVIKSPVSGTIKQMNSHVMMNPSLINSSPYNKGWILMIEPSNWSREIQFMKRAAGYRQWIRKELIRLKDFLAVYVNSISTGNKPVLQDGGELQDQLLTSLGPQVWEDFQKNFIDAE